MGSRSDGSGRIRGRAVRLVEVSGRTQGRSPGTSASAFRRCGAGSTSAVSTRSRRRRPNGRRTWRLAKRLRRENEILRQEREILKRAATFFAKEGSR